VKRLLAILTIDSVRELLRYKSFFLLIIIVIGIDRLLSTVFGGSKDAVKARIKALATPEAAKYFFTELPALIKEMVLDPRVFIALAVLFLSKQLISLWPSSDMRRMHRMDRGASGFVGSLFSLELRQVAWDFGAVATVVAAALIWAVGAFAIGSLVADKAGYVVGLGVFAFVVLVPWPLFMAGFSFSSKIAVISCADARVKTALFTKLVTDARTLAWTWGFFAFRIVLESLFVLAVPGYLLLFIESWYLRVPLAGLSAALSYSFLKMASFKFFLEIYSSSTPVRCEYAKYFDR